MITFTSPSEWWFEGLALFIEITLALKTENLNFLPAYFGHCNVSHMNNVMSTSLCKT